MHQNAYFLSFVPVCVGTNMFLISLNVKNALREAEQTELIAHQPSRPPCSHNTNIHISQRRRGAELIKPGRDEATLANLERGHLVYGEEQLVGVSVLGDFARQIGREETSCNPLRQAGRAPDAAILIVLPHGGSLPS